MTPFKVHRIKGYICNIFLLEYEHGLLLLDSGTRPDVARIEKFCREELKRPMSDIKLCLVSHMHPDHAGGAQTLRRKHGIPIGGPERSHRWYAGLSGAIQWLLDCFMAQQVALANREPFRSVLFRRRLRPDIILKDGDSLPCFNEWRVLEVPGHTLHDLVFYHDASRTIYAADSVIEVKGSYKLPIPIKFSGRMYQSYARLKELPIAEMLLAHGEPQHHPDTQAIFDELIRQLDAGPSKLMKRVYWYTIFSPEVWQSWLKAKLKACC